MKVTLEVDLYVDLPALKDAYPSEYDFAKMDGMSDEEWVEEVYDEVGLLEMIETGAVEVESEYVVSVY